MRSAPRKLGSHCGREGFLIAPQAVAQQRTRVVRPSERRILATRGRRPGDRFDQSCQLRFPSPDPRNRDGSVRRHRAIDRLDHRPHLLDQPRGVEELSCECLRQDARRKGHRQDGEGTRLAGELDVTGCHEVEGVVVPQVQRDDRGVCGDQRSASSLEMSSLRNALTARFSVGAPAANPATNVVAQPSRSRSHARGTGARGGAASAARATSWRPPEPEGRPANWAAHKASR